MENVQDKVGLIARMNQLIDLTDDGSMTPLMEFINEIVINAYIAGANRVNISAEFKTELNDTGTLLVDAVNYSKDKGFNL